MNSGTLTVLAAAAQILAIILGVLAYKRGAQESKTSDRRRADELAARLSLATTPTKAFDEIQDALAKRGAADASPRIEPMSQSSSSVEDAISKALKEIPNEIRTANDQRVQALLEESRAQELAENINTEFRPRLILCLETISDTISKSNELGLAQVIGSPEELAIPNRVAFTTFTMMENGIEEEDVSAALVWKFDGDIIWKVYPKLGMVRSPASLARSWDAPTDKYYPMLRIQEIGSGMNTTILGTVAFDLATKHMMFAFNARNTSRPQLQSAIEKLQAEKDGIDLLKEVIVQLLKEIKIRSENT